MAVALLGATVGVWAQVAQVVQDAQALPSSHDEKAPLAAAAVPKGGALLNAELKPEATPSASPTPPGLLLRPLRPQELSHTAAQVLAQVNALRAAGAVCGNRRMVPTGPLRWNARLEQAALAHSRDQAQRQVISHDGGDGSNHAQRANRAGYPGVNMGENVAMGQADLKAAVIAWLHSPGHCQNMLEPRFVELGVARADDINGRPFYTMLLARRNGYDARLATFLDTEDQDSPVVAEAIAVLNRQRAQGGQCGEAKLPPAKPLVWDERLRQVAAWEVAARIGNALANDPGGDLATRAQKAGFAAQAVISFKLWGPSSPLQVLHRRIVNHDAASGPCLWLMSASVTHIGMAPQQRSAISEDSSHDWTLVLASERADSAPNEAGSQAQALQTINTVRTRGGARCFGSAVPKRAAVSSHPAIESVLQTMPLAKRELDLWQLLSDSGLNRAGMSSAVALPISAAGAVATLEQAMTGKHCEDLLSPKLRHLGARLQPTADGNGQQWLLILDLGP